MGLLRLRLALTVVINHSPAGGAMFLPDNATTVQLFFLISGFYIFLVLDGGYRDHLRGDAVTVGHHRPRSHSRVPGASARCPELPVRQVSWRSRARTAHCSLGRTATACSGLPAAGL